MVLSELGLHCMTCCNFQELKAHTHLADLPSGDTSEFRILNMFDMNNHPTIVKSVVESADSAL